MHSLRIDPEAVTSDGAQSLYFAALDELNRRYGPATREHDFANYEPPTGFFLVARLDAHLAGGVGVRAFADLDATTAEIKRLWVRPDLRRGGVAAALLASAEERSRLVGYDRLYLETGTKQPEAIALYEKTGWTRVDRYPHRERQFSEGVIFTKTL